MSIFENKEMIDEFISKLTNPESILELIKTFTAKSNETNSQKSTQSSQTDECKSEDNKSEVIKKLNDIHLSACEFLKKVEVNKTEVDTEVIELLSSLKGIFDLIDSRINLEKNKKEEMSDNEISNNESFDTSERKTVTPFINIENLSVNF